MQKNELYANVSSWTLSFAWFQNRFESYVRMFHDKTVNMFDLYNHHNLDYTFE